jgi:hypothetical protein
MRRALRNLGGDAAAVVRFVTAAAERYVEKRSGGAPTRSSSSSPVSHDRSLSLPRLPLPLPPRCERPECRSGARLLRTSCRRPSARRPDRLADYMGYRADRWEGHVIGGTH